jgi:hypothetical protein
MENGLTTTGGNMPANYSKNVWEEYGEQAGGQRHIVGKLLKFSKGEWLAGTNGDEIPEGTQMVAIMDSLMAGWVKWQDSKPVEHRMVQVTNGEKPARRKELDSLEEKEWENGNDGRPMDPWQFTNYIVLINSATKEVFTFTTASRGGQGAIGNLCKVYGKNIRQQPNDYPSIELRVDSYRHKDKALGKIFVPVFEVHGWTNKESWQAAVEGASATVQEERDSSIPFDGAGPAPADGLDIPAGLDRRAKPKSKTQF